MKEILRYRDIGYDAQKALATIKYRFLIFFHDLASQTIRPQRSLFNKYLTFYYLPSSNIFFFLYPSSHSTFNCLNHNISYAESKAVL